MDLRASLVEVARHKRNADDGEAFLASVDSTLQTAISQTRRARELGVNARGALGESSRTALANEIEQLRDSLLSLANTTHLDRPVFGGHTPGTQVYDDAGSYVGVPGEVSRTVGPGVKIRVDLDADAAFGPHDANLFADLDALAEAVRAGDDAAISTGLGALDAGLERLGAAVVDVGSRMARVERAADQPLDREVDLTASLGAVEDVDMPRALMELQLQQTAYQAALASTARVMQPSLLDFLR